jgi:single-strand DNA-binding protein
MNKVFLIGNLTKNPELSKTTGDISYCRMTIAVNRNYTNQDGERVTDFFNIIAWRGLAETCDKYLSKGKKISVIGSLQTRQYEHNGEKRWLTEIVAEEIEFLSPKEESKQGYLPIEDDPDFPF